MAVPAAVWVGLVSPRDYAAFKFPPTSRHDRDGSSWATFPEAFGYLVRAPSVTVASGPGGASCAVALHEELMSDLSGAAMDSTALIPDRAIVLGVSTRTLTAITGATSYECGIAGEADKFGGSLAIGAGSSNVGVIGPQAFYADTPIRLTANGGDFTGGAVRIAIHSLILSAPAP